MRRNLRGGVILCNPGDNSPFYLRFKKLITGCCILWGVCYILWVCYLRSFTVRRCAVIFFHTDNAYRGCPRLTALGHDPSSSKVHGQAWNARRLPGTRFDNLSACISRKPGIIPFQVPSVPMPFGGSYYTPLVDIRIISI